jgi:Flp pilus assembly pilin Flp
MKLVSDFISDESGATAIEYGLIASLISVGTKMSATFKFVAGQLKP